MLLDHLAFVQRRLRLGLAAAQRVPHVAGEVSRGIEEVLNGTRKAAGEALELLTKAVEPDSTIEGRMRELAKRLARSVGEAYIRLESMLARRPEGTRERVLVCKIQNMILGDSWQALAPTVMKTKTATYTLLYPRPAFVTIPGPIVEDHFDLHTRLSRSSVMYSFFVHSQRCYYTINPWDEDAEPRRVPEIEGSNEMLHITVLQGKTFVLDHRHGLQLSVLLPSPETTPAGTPLRFHQLASASLTPAPAADLGGIFFCALQSRYLVVIGLTTVHSLHHFIAHFWCYDTLDPEGGFRQYTDLSLSTSDSGCNWACWVGDGGYRVEAALGGKEFALDLRRQKVILCNQGFRGTPATNAVRGEAVVRDGAAMIPVLASSVTAGLRLSMKTHRWETLTRTKGAVAILFIRQAGKYYQMEVKSENTMAEVGNMIGDAMMGTRNVKLMFLASANGDLDPTATVAACGLRPGMLHTLSVAIHLG